MFWESENYTICDVNGLNWAIWHYHRATRKEQRSHTRDHYNSYFPAHKFHTIMSGSNYNPSFPLLYAHQWLVYYSQQTCLPVHLQLDIMERHNNNNNHSNFAVCLLLKALNSWCLRLCKPVFITEFYSLYFSRINLCTFYKICRMTKNYPSALNIYLNKLNDIKKLKHSQLKGIPKKTHWF